MKGAGVRFRGQVTRILCKWPELGKGLNSVLLYLLCPLHCHHFHCQDKSKKVLESAACPSSRVGHIWSTRSSSGAHLCRRDTDILEKVQ